MPIAITPEHNDLADSVRSLVARVAPSDVLHEALETPIPNPPPYWKAAAEQGLQGVHLAESVGGQGFGILELAIVLAEFGYGAVPGPFVPSAIASALISAHDPDAKLLNDLASGEVIAAYAIDSGLTATRHGDGLVIRGEVRAVPAAAQASVLVLPVAIDSGEEWVVLDADALEIEPVKSVDPLRPLAHVRANAVEVGDDRVLSTLGRTLARALMSTLLSAEAIGVARWATDTATAYAKIREQFGRPIGQFQAIKHMCAGMVAETERATAAVWDAARAIDEDDSVSLYCVSYHRQAYELGWKEVAFFARRVFVRPKQWIRLNRDSYANSSPRHRRSSLPQFRRLYPSVSASAGAVHAVENRARRQQFNGRHHSHSFDVAARNVYCHQCSERRVCQCSESSC